MHPSTPDIEICASGCHDQGQPMSNGAMSNNLLSPIDQIVSWAMRNIAWIWIYLIVTLFSPTIVETITTLNDVNWRVHRVLPSKVLSMSACSGWSQKPADICISNAGTHSILDASKIKRFAKIRPTFLSPNCDTNRDSESSKMRSLCVGKLWGKFSNRREIIENC